MYVSDRPRTSTTTHCAPRVPSTTTTKAKKEIYTSQPTSQTIDPTMAPKKNISTTPSPSAIPTSAAKPTAGVTSASGQPTRAANKPSSTTTSSSMSSNNGQVRNAQDLQNIGLGVWNKYVDQTPQRVKLLDAFLIFLMAVGVLQFVYCVIAGNFVSILETKGTAGEQQRTIRLGSRGRQEIID
jgi:hypothetical protein